MPKRNWFQSIVMEGPPTKLSRLHSPQRKPKQIDDRNIDIKRPVTICDLPTEILDKIIGNINIWHHNRIRGTCRRMKEVNDIFVMHEFQKALRKHLAIDPKSEASAGLLIIKQATEVYINSGFESTFCGCILPMLRNCYKDPFNPGVTLIKRFLVHFYVTVSELIGDTSSQRWRLLYTITLMRLLRTFEKSTISCATLQNQWKAEVELNGPWLGKLWSSKRRTLCESRYRCNLLVVLSEMLMANICGRGFKNVWECPSAVYIFGNDTNNGSYLPKTTFTFTVCNSKKVRNIFRSCLEDEPGPFKCPSELFNDKFIVNLDIFCKEVVRRGCPQIQHLEIGSL